MTKQENVEHRCSKGHIFVCSKGTIDLRNDTIIQETPDKWQSRHCPQCFIDELIDRRQYAETQ